MRKSHTTTSFHSKYVNPSLSKINMVEENKAKISRDTTTGLYENGNKNFRISKGKNVKIPDEFFSKPEITSIRDHAAAKQLSGHKENQSRKYSKLTLNLKKVNEPEDPNSGSILTHPGPVVRFSSDVHNFGQALVANAKIQTPKDERSNQLEPSKLQGKKSSKDSLSPRRTTRAIPIMPNDMIYKDIGTEADPMDEHVERAGVKNINKWENDKILEQGRQGVIFRGERSVW
jgi:hypothetical protein